MAQHTFDVLAAALNSRANVERVARYMFERQAATFDADSALVELAWLDDDIRAFWVAEAISVIAYLADLAGSLDPSGVTARLARLMVVPHTD